ncbi:hypothetical protein NUW54_g12025 [Trametes sanguinea]|uniref:Uncharacterized protein n=1 Tax=Trametes sanguinea TaxID=158606 RepID=A0ACC1N5F3_9APHY|nr:hypothetical protein NUW54_g12025 [Trametes sanguinea]
MIGVNILGYPEEFKMAFEDNQDDIAVHTWTHPYMTTKTDLEVVGELGWTMEIIHNSTGGRLPKYWRPPYGDSDNRVSAIAKEVFGLTTVIWNQDTEDWSIVSLIPWAGLSFVLTVFLSNIRDTDREAREAAAASPRDATTTETLADPEKVLQSEKAAEP